MHTVVQSVRPSASPASRVCFICAFSVKCACVDWKIAFSFDRESESSYQTSDTRLKFSRLSRGVDVFFAKGTRRVEQASRRCTDYRTVPCAYGVEINVKINYLVHVYSMWPGPRVRNPRATFIYSVAALESCVECATD